MQELASRAESKDVSASKKQKAKAKSKKQHIEQKVAQQQSETWRPQVGDMVEVPKLGQEAVVQGIKGKILHVSTALIR